MNVLKKFLLGCFALMLITMAAGCNTFRGMGKDIQSGGEAVEDTAEDVQEDM